MNTELMVSLMYFRERRNVEPRCWRGQGGGYISDQQRQVSHFTAARTGASLSLRTLGKAEGHAGGAAGRISGAWNAHTFEVVVVERNGYSGGDKIH